MILIISNAIHPNDFFNLSMCNIIKLILSNIIGENNIYVINGFETDKFKEYVDNNIAKIKGVILTGSSLRISKKIDLNMILNNFNALNIFKVPILGVCFGYQLIGKLNYSKIGFYPRLENKYKSVFLANDPLFLNLNNSIYPPVFYFHHYDYLKTCPVNYKIIAKTSDKYIAAIKHQTREIYGIQFHPENSHNNFQLYKNFISICKIPIL